MVCTLDGVVFEWTKNAKKNDGPRPGKTCSRVGCGRNSKGVTCQKTDTTSAAATDNKTSKKTTKRNLCFRVRIGHLTVCIVHGRAVGSDGETRTESTVEETKTIKSDEIGGPAVIPVVAFVVATVAEGVM